MRAIILAGGVGSRISREVNKPKSLLDIGDGKPLLRYTVEMLQKRGIEVSIVLGYKKEMFYDALAGLDVTFYFNPFSLDSKRVQPVKNSVFEYNKTWLEAKESLDNFKKSHPEFTDENFEKESNEYYDIEGDTYDEYNPWY